MTGEMDNAFQVQGNAGERGIREKGGVVSTSDFTVDICCVRAAVELGSAGKVAAPMQACKMKSEPLPPYPALHVSAVWLFWSCRHQI